MTTRLTDLIAVCKTCVYVVQGYTAHPDGTGYYGTRYKVLWPHKSGWMQGGFFPTDDYTFTVTSHKEKRG